MKQKGMNFAVALVHAGCLRTNRPAPEDVILLREFARIGYGIVAASHSHRISGAEKIFRPGKCPSFLFHGLGTLVSGYIATPVEREGLIVVAGFDTAGKVAEVTVRPVYLPDLGIGEVPTPEMAETILSRFGTLSVEIAEGSYAARFYKDMSSGLVQLYLRDVNAAFRHSGLRGLAQKAARVRLSHVKRLMHTIFVT
jgi:poly-gamma-glutamate capsule biosynthesis protein CapA/YwtB (metallophosphatase superfamily)